MTVIQWQIRGVMGRFRIDQQALSKSRDRSATLLVTADFIGLSRIDPHGYRQIGMFVGPCCR